MVPSVDGTRLAGKPWDPPEAAKAAHPNSRFTAPASQCPCISPEFDNPKGVPISAILFGARRQRRVPLVFQAENWQHGTFLGATLASETTVPRPRKVGVLRRDSDGHAALLRLPTWRLLRALAGGRRRSARRPASSA